MTHNHKKTHNILSKFKSFLGHITGHPGLRAACGLQAGHPLEDDLLNLFISVKKRFLGMPPDCPLVRYLSSLVNIRASEFRE